ncbi:MAG: peptidylprolyl isomerase [Clostridia bacterium]|nr:peptidylprolyl isomerase [Clostridia bacterium]
MFAESVQNPVFMIELASGGTMSGVLYPDVAPESVGNFIELANSGFYDGVIFHRVIPGFMIQGGDPLGVGTGGPGYSITGEFNDNGVGNPISHTYGVLSMARASHPDSAGSQFFIVVSDASFLDGQYAAFGLVGEGMEFADEIVNTPRDQSDKPLSDQIIQSIRVETFGAEYPFEKLAAR